MGESVFDMSEMLESINGGVDRYDMQQLYPISGNINTAVVGSGQASGLTTFQWQDSANWWSPCQSYFILRLRFHAAGIVPPAGSTVTYADNFIMTLFSQLNSYINSRPLDTVNTPWIIDTALTYSNAKQNFIKTWGSLTRVGEPLTTRLKNVQLNDGLIEVVFRPPLSIFDTKLLPPGAQFRLDFNWANNGLLAFESVGGPVEWNTSFTSTTAGTVSIQVESFSFYKAALHAGHGVALPSRGVVDLMPCQALQYFVNGGSILKQNITMPPTTNRILIVFQDANPSPVSNSPPVNNISGVGKGYTPATSFQNVFTTASISTDNQLFSSAACLSQLWLSLPELGIQEPTPVYTFTNPLTADGQDYMRAYGDFCQISQGTHHQSEGSIPFGNSDVDGGITIVHINNTAANSFIQLGDPNNPQQYTLLNVGATAPAAGSYNQTTRWGWYGRCPGPIFAFPVVRPEGRNVTTGTLNVQFSGSVTSVVATIIASYSMAIALELQAGGYYSYTLVEGV